MLLGGCYYGSENTLFFLFCIIVIRMTKTGEQGCASLKVHWL